MTPRERQLPGEILTLLFEVGGLLVKGLLLGLECIGVPSEVPTHSFDAGDMLAEGVPVRLDARHTPPLVLEKRPKQRRRAVQRLSNLIECAQCLATAVCALLEQQVQCLARLSYPIGQRRGYIQSFDSYFVMAKVSIDELLNFQLDRT